MPDLPDAFPEFVGSFSIVAFVVIAAGAWLRLLPRFWVAFTGFFACLSLGPFIHIAGINTYVIGPWALLRYVPVIGMARSPSRLAVVAVLGMSILLAFAVEELRRRYAIPRWAVALLALMVAIELLPAPRPLYSAAVPDVYRLIAATGNESGRLLELPTGIRDGTSSLGDFNASSAYFQTSHKRPLIGGYLSRVSSWRKTESRRTPMLRALFALSEGRRTPGGATGRGTALARRLPPTLVRQVRRRQQAAGIDRSPGVRRRCPRPDHGARGRGLRALHTRQSAGL